MPSFTDFPAPLAPGDYIFTNPTAPFCLKQLGTLDPNNNITKVVAFECNQATDFWKVQTAKDPFTGSNYAVTIEYGKTGQNFLNRTGVVGVATGATGESETLWRAVDVNPPGSNGRIMRISQYEQPGPNNYPLKCLTLKYIGTTPPDGIPLDVEDCLNSKEPNSVYQQFYFSPKDTWPGPLVL